MGVKEKDVRLRHTTEAKLGREHGVASHRDVIDTICRSTLKMSRVLSVTCNQGNE